jgi:hypothetical protein
MTVHPMRYEAIKAFLRKANSGWQLIEKLLASEKLVEFEYEGNKYYMWKLEQRRK